MEMCHGGNMKSIVKTKKGFTLVELVIVIVIVGILSVISVPIYRGYVEKAKMVEGNVLLNAIAKAELAYHVKYGGFVNDGSGYGNGIGKGRYLDIDSSGNKYFKEWYVKANNKYPVGKSSVNKIASGELATYDEEADEALIQAGYDTPQGWVVVSMTVYSTGGCSDIETLRFGHGGGGDEEVANVK